MTAQAVRLVLAVLCVSAMIQGIACVIVLSQQACENAGLHDCGGCVCEEGPAYNYPTLSMAMRHEPRHRVAVTRLSIALVGLALIDGALVTDTFREGGIVFRATVLVIGALSFVVMLASLLSDPAGDPHINLAVLWVGLRIVGGFAVLHLSGATIGWASAGALPLFVLGVRIAWAFILVAFGTICAAAAFGGDQDGELQMATIVSAMAFVASFCVDIARGPPPPAAVASGNA